MKSDFVSEGGDEFEYGIGTESPYYAVILTSEQAQQILHRQMEFYSTNGKTLFEVKDKLGKPTGEMAFFVVFK